MRSPKWMASWGYLRFLVRAERVITPFARVCVVVLWLGALWRALQGRWIAAVVLVLLVVVLVALLRWDPPLIEVEIEDGPEK